jgi:hypothetical protein
MLTYPGTGEFIPAATLYPSVVYESPNTNIYSVALQERADTNELEQSKPILATTRLRATTIFRERWKG